MRDEAPAGFEREEYETQRAPAKDRDLAVLVLYVVWLTAQRRQRGVQFDTVLGAGEAFYGWRPEPMLGRRHVMFWTRSRHNGRPQE